MAMWHTTRLMPTPGSFSPNETGLPALNGVSLPGGTVDSTTPAFSWAASTMVMRRFRQKPGWAAMEFSGFAQDSLNCHCFDPTETLVLESQRVEQSAGGAVRNVSRLLQRLPLSTPPGRESVVRAHVPREGKMNLQIRAEFTNIFNRQVWGIRWRQMPRPLRLPAVAC